MTARLFQKIAFSGLASALVVGAGLVTSAGVEPAPAYGSVATKLEADAAARHAAHVYHRADLDNDGALDGEEFKVLAIVGAELARLNGFIAVDLSASVQTVAVAKPGGALMTPQEKGAIAARAEREFAYFAGEDQKLGVDEFIAATLEDFVASDRDRNGLLTGAELATFAAAQVSVPRLTS